MGTSQRLFLHLSLFLCGVIVGRLSLWGSYCDRSYASCLTSLSREALLSPTLTSQLQVLCHSRISTNACPPCNRLDSDSGPGAVPDAAAEVPERASPAEKKEGEEPTAVREEDTGSAARSDSKEVTLMTHAAAGPRLTPGAAKFPGLPPQCSRRHFMYVTTSYGQHSNQLIGLLNAFVIAKLLNRTLIIGNFVYNTYHKLATYNTSDDGHVEGDRKRKVINRRYIVPTELYNFQEFNNNGYCHVMREEYFGAYPAPQNAECFRPDKDFIRMWDTRCVKTVITRRLKGRKAVGLAQQSDAPLIYMPETYWLQPEGTQLPYALLRPSGLIVNEVDHFKATILQTTVYTAVHIRMLKSSGHSVCESSLAELLTTMGPIPESRRKSILKQCRMDWAYIEDAQAEAGVSGQKLFLATDRQQVDLDNRLMAHGAVSYHTGIFKPTCPYGLMVDFWLMVDSQVLICNMASSIDWNVCNVRISRGRPCHNWVNHTWPHWSGAY